MIQLNEHSIASGLSMHLSESAPERWAAKPAHKLATALSLVILLLLPGMQSEALGRAQDANYLPLFVGAKWVLRNPYHATPVVFQVVEQNEDGFHIQSTYPWGASEWTLAAQGSNWLMTSFGANGQRMPLTDNPLYLDFTSQVGTSWFNALGLLAVASRTAVVPSGASTYQNCIQIRHQVSGGVDLVSTFASGIGYVQFGEGDSAFVIDPSASILPVQQPALPTTPPVLIGLAPNPFAYEPLTVDVMTMRFNQTLTAGVSFVVGSGEWANLELQPGQYSLDSVTQLVAFATPANLPIYYTLRVINTVARDVPQDLQTVSWSDPRMQARVLGLIEAIAPLINGHVQWFTFGYEVDGYLATHPGEVQDFIALHRLATARMKQLVPGIKVSCTMTFANLSELEGSLATLDSQMDFLAITYCPLKPDFTVEDPSVLPGDFAVMRQAAGARKLILQEIAYPSSPIAGSSEDMQAQFYRLAFHEIARNPAAYDAVNFMMLADLSSALTDQYANYYGMSHLSFKAVLQTLGMFDGQGNPKKGWGVFVDNTRH